MIKCPNCRAELSYDIKDKLVKCPYCDSKFSPQELNEKATVAKVYNKIDAKSYSCKNCGAELLTFDDTAVTFCNYCGSSNMLEDRAIEINAPEYIIPFKITKEEAINIYRKKIDKSLFAPKYMKNKLVLEKIRGIYMPYCIYNMGYTGKTSNNGSKYYKRVGDYQYYKDYTIKADIDTEVNGISYELVSNFYDEYSEAINPFDFSKAEEFNINYLSGFYADVLDLDKKLYSEKAKSIAREYTTKQMKKNKTFSKYGCDYPRAPIRNKSESYGMFPVYFMAFRDNTNKKISYAVINGQTGKIAVDIPIDRKKYIIASIFLMIPLFFLYNMIFNINIKGILIISILISFISIIISCSLVKKINNRRNNKEDLGLIYKNKDNNTKKDNKVSYFKYIFKEIVAILIGILIFIINPFEDMFYYITSIITCILNVLVFIDIINEHNMLTIRPIPQLEKRGGDVDA